MLSQANHWLEFVSAAVDVFLLCRVLLLRLQRIYLFITLACLLTVFYDAIGIWLDSDPGAAMRVLLFSRFVYALVFPLVGWDVFEEMKPQITKLRRLALGKLISGLLFATICGLLISVFVQSAFDTNDTGTGILVTIALVLWAGASTATLGFIWTLQRATRAQHIERPRNTSVWIVFWELSLISEVLYCFCWITLPALKSVLAADIVDLLFMTYGMAITVWCIVKLRAVPSNVPTAPAGASL